MLARMTGSVFHVCVCFGEGYDSCSLSLKVHISEYKQTTSRGKSHQECWWVGSARHGGEPECAHPGDQAPSGEAAGWRLD